MHPEKGQHPLVEQAAQLEARVRQLYADFEAARASDDPPSQADYNLLCGHAATLHYLGHELMHSALRASHATPDTGAELPPGV